MNWSNIWSKIKHAFAPAAGAAVAVAVPLVLGGNVDAKTVAQAAGGAFLGYLIKPARPAQP